MQNLYMTPLKYKNFAGVERTTKLYFHLTPREFADWMVDHMDEARRMQNDFEDMQLSMTENPEGEASEAQKMSMLRLVKILAELSNGRPDTEGEIFDKSELEKFKHSAAYDGFRLFLFQNPSELQTFLNTLLSPEVMNEFGQLMAGSEAAQDVTQKQPANGQQKDPQNMTHEELVAAMRDRVQNQ